MAETRRAACDRCHAQKLRCLHSPGSDGRCVRCVRADVECVFSPRAARGSLMGHCRGSTSRPRSRPLALSDTHTTSQRQPQSQHPPTPHLVPPPPASRPDPLLAPPFTFDAAAFATDTASTLNSLLGAPTDVDAWQLHLPATPLETGPGHIVRRLADLNVGLYDCAAAIPPLAPRDATASSGSPPKAQHGRLLALDRIFSQTQALVDILRDLNALPAATPADRATLLLVLSCYDRTMAVHEHILAHMRGCVERALTPRHADGATVVLPPLHIGSYAPPPSSAVAMQMLLVVIMAAQLLDQLQLALGVRPSGCAPSASPAASPADSVLAATEEDEKEEGGWETGAWQLELPPGKPHADFSDDEVDAMRERAVSVSREIVQVKALLLERSAT